MKYIVTATALLLVTLTGARADTELFNDHWTDALNIRPAACPDERGEKTPAWLRSQAARPCRLERAARRAVRSGLSDGLIACKADILHSEELPGAPIFYHHVKADLLVTPPGRPAFEATVENLTPWQVPPPRRGERLTLWCDPASPIALKLP
jgi:hypothetical protein